ncbi:hypothetical protein NW762_011499 [Fusarium torreyae]|uniref:2EXR domain-containing protein n=1 Tax=Fusarium torreyae TaxID=1237075 RepID=A0A9W8VCE2_9HYPO|nr:hypothetical protein NW762_011499 [Fusarium torreyae]
MAPSTFHPFSRLPAELRLQIWEAACFPSSRHHRGLHYIDVSYFQRPEEPKENWVIPLEGQNSGCQSDSSAYLWDGGLWNTCKESREVIKCHTHIDDWLRIHQHLSPKGPLLMTCKGDWDGGEEAVPPGKLTFQKPDENWNLVVYPARDIFCVKTSDLKKLSMFHPMDLNVSSIRSGKSSTLWVQNIALEFDSSWNSSFPHRIFGSCQEMSDRGLLAEMLLGLCRDYQVLASDLWIIDKTAHWVRNANRDLGTVYHDCDDEYVEVGLYDTRSESTGEGYYSDVTSFISNLGEWADRDLDAFGRAYDPWIRAVPNREPFKVAKSIRLLVRRSNEVSEVTDVEDSCAN